jgi:hypothetical protein
MEEIIQSLIAQAVAWHKNLNEIETLVADWETRKPEKNSKTK